MILERVDLPAPFSPVRACTSPARNSRLTLSSARTPGNDLLIPSTRRKGALVAIGAPHGDSDAGESSTASHLEPGSGARGAPVRSAGRVLNLFPVRNNPSRFLMVSRDTRSAAGAAPGPDGRGGAGRPTRPSAPRR